LVATALEKMLPPIELPMKSAASTFMISMKRRMRLINRACPPPKLVCLSESEPVWRNDTIKLRKLWKRELPP
jgi:hypothetical protein